MYHDVVDGPDCAASGFPGRHSAIYKLGRRDFGLHLAAIERAVAPRFGGEDGRAQPVILTFDDGGVSAYGTIAPMLEEHGWRGYFFVTTGCIGQPGFLTADQIRELDRRGHIIGSHSQTHPRRISRLPWDHLVTEWQSSVESLEEILDHAVTTASVPGGDYSRQVAEAAASAGIRTLFTSEPTKRTFVVNGCRVLGRYTIQRGMGPKWASTLASGQWAARFRQAALWNAKRAAKRLAGGAYFRFQDLVFSTDRND